MKVQAAAKADVKLGPIERGDVLQMAMTFPPRESEEVSFSVRVGADGQAPLPIVGAMKLEGLTTADATVGVEKAMNRIDPKAHQTVWMLKVESGDRPTIAHAPIAPGDAVEVLVTGLEPPVWRCIKPVEPDGTIRLPFLGNVSIAHLTESDAQAAVVHAYEKNDPSLQPAFTIRQLAVEGARSSQLTPDVGGGTQRRPGPLSARG